jgi:hypothetical protein
MCEKCIEIDNTILRYQRITTSINDSLTVERANKLIADFKVQKAALHSDRTNCDAGTIRGAGLESRLFVALEYWYGPMDALDSSEP